MPANNGVIVFTSPGVFTDAGGIQIYIGSDGKIHIKRVPGWDPQVLTQVTTAVSLVSHAAQIKDAGLRKRLEGLADEILQANSKALQTYVQQPQQG